MAYIRKYKWVGLDWVWLAAKLRHEHLLQINIIVSLLK